MSSQWIEVGAVWIPVWAYIHFSYITLDVVSWAVLYIMIQIPTKRTCWLSLMAPTFPREHSQCKWVSIVSLLSAGSWFGVFLSLCWLFCFKCLLLQGYMITMAEEKKKFNWREATVIKKNYRQKLMVCLLIFLIEKIEFVTFYFFFLF